MNNPLSILNTSPSRKSTWTFALWIVDKFLNKYLVFDWIHFVYKNVYRFVYEKFDQANWINYLGNQNNLTDLKSYLPQIPELWHLSLSWMTKESEWLRLTVAMNNWLCLLMSSYMLVAFKWSETWPKLVIWITDLVTSKHLFILNWCVSDWISGLTIECFLTEQKLFKVPHNR